MSDRTLSVANRHPRLRFDRRDLTRAVAVLDAHAAQFRGGCPPGELSVVFLTDAALAQLHGEFLDDPTITDVITFSAPAENAFDPEKVAGEICISADAAVRQARDTRKFSEELTLYVVHGWLHLAGYDDLQPAKKRAMRAAEKRAMVLLRAEAKLPAFVLRR
jgi:probable rRNA maturation factor